MSVQWLSDLPDMRSGFGFNIRMSIDSARQVHLAYILPPVDPTTIHNQLVHAIGSPGSVFLRPSGTGYPTATQEYQWALHDDVLPVTTAWDDPSTLFDLAVDSMGRAHICFNSIPPNIGPPSLLAHAVSGLDGSTFASMAVLPGPVQLTGLAMTVAGDDSVHIAFAENLTSTEIVTKVAPLRYSLPAPAKLLLDQNNVLHVAYQGSQAPSGTGQVRFATSTPSEFATSTVSFWTKETVDPTIDSGSSISAAMDPKTGEPHIAYGVVSQSGQGAVQLKHEWALDVILLPLPHKKGPINVHPLPRL